MKRFPTRRVSSLLVCAALLACGEDAAGPVAGGTADLDVLFVGNSLTYTYDVPGLVEAFSRTGSGTRIRVGSLTRGGYSLEDHWNEGIVQGMIQTGGWDVVVLQQGPSSLPQNRIHLVEWSGRFADLVEAEGGQVALYMVWPGRDRFFAFADVAGSYRAAAEATGGVLLPAGEAWLEAWRLDPNAPLYGEDEFHQAPAGSYLAAAVAFRALTGRAATGLPADVTTSSGIRVRLGAGLAETLQRAAHNVLPLPVAENRGIADSP